jgi:colanic acid biosynthesis glycosyl transferase WcaI
VRVLIVGLNYLPESTSIGPYTAALAEHLHSTGHAVHVVTGFPMAPQWRIWDGYRGKWFSRDVINGVNIIRTYLFVPREPRKPLNRILFDCSFALSALVGGLFTGGCEAVIVISPPLQLGITGWVLARLKRARLFVHLQDLVPEAAVATGMLAESSPSVRIGRAIQRFVYKRADRLGVICDGFAQNLAHKGVPRTKVALLPNFIDLQFIKTFPRDNAFRQRHGLRDNDFVVMYSGSIALKQGLEVFVDAAIALRNEPTIRFLLIGDGPADFVAELRARAQQAQLNNLHFLPLQPRDNLPEQLSAADVLVVTQKRAVTDIVFPGKLLYYMAAGRAILAAVSAESETGRFILENKVGLVVPPEEPNALAQAILHMKANGAVALGQQGRRIAESKFDRQHVLPRFGGQLADLIRQERS